MPRPDQIAVVIAGGQKYDIWTQIEVSRSVPEVIDHALLTVAEISPRQRGVVSSLKLAPGDDATVTLAAQLVLKRSGLSATSRGRRDQSPGADRHRRGRPSDHIVGGRRESWAICEFHTGANRIGLFRQGRREFQDRRCIV